MKGRIFNIQNFSVNDGDGIRTIIFLAGCPLKCSWCSNPENWDLHSASEISVQDIENKLHSQNIFYRFSGGGITFSGGEATFQTDFFNELVQTLYDDGYSLALETCGYFDFNKVKISLSKMDTIFMDLKHIDSDKHRYYTGKDNTLILENIINTYNLTNEKNIDFIIRIPTIVGVNEDLNTMEKTFLFLKENTPHVKIEFLPYHEYGLSKYQELGLREPSKSFKTPSADNITKLQVMAESYGLKNVSFK
ncbi:MAG: radical SAM protein [Lachnospiraceae bacterium]|jgi:pyruvate formate lyase activating enzyme|nr:radical SAM protein [Lachnospiraceae bacterium]